MKTIHEFELFHSDLGRIINGLRRIEEHTGLAEIFVEARELLIAGDLVVISIRREEQRT